MFQSIANMFPTQKMAESKFLSALWRILFYLFKPSASFVMRLPYYRALVFPKKGTLTRVLIRRGCWEKELTERFACFVKPGGFVVDAGANFGNYALTASGLMKGEGLVLAFEPHPVTFDLLRQNIALQDEPVITAEQAALGDKPGELELVTDQDNPGGHSFNPGQVWRAGVSEKVRVVALDDYLAEHGITQRLDLLKSDTEGFDFKVLKGARQTIERDRPTVFCEVSPGGLREAGDNYEELLAFFEDLGYRASMQDKGSRRIVDMSFRDLSALLADLNDDFRDVIFVHPGNR